MAERSFHASSQSSKNNYSDRDEDYEGWLKKIARWTGWKDLEEYADFRASFVKCAANLQLFEECAAKHSANRCRSYRNLLVSDCKAVWDGKSLQFPNGRVPRHERDYMEESIRRREEREQKEAIRLGFNSAEDHRQYKLRKHSTRACKGTYDNYIECVRKEGWGHGKELCDRIRDQDTKQYCAPANRSKR